MQYRLRTLLIVLALGPPVLAWFLFLGWVLCCGTSVWYFIGLIETAILGLVVAAVLGSIWVAIAQFVHERKLNNLKKTIEHNRKELENTRLTEEV